MKLLVCGSRDWDDENTIWSILDGYYENDTLGHLTVTMASFTLIEGGAKGADACAHRWAKNSPLHSHNERPDDPEFRHVTVNAKWDEHHPKWCPSDWCAARDYCVGAGPRRNQRMIDRHKPDLVLAFKNGFNWKLNKGGTEDMVSRAIAAEIDYYVIGRK
jgi:hypothetical protein